MIYYLRTSLGEVWVLTAYKKNVVDSIPARVLRKIRDEIDDKGKT